MNRHIVYIIFAAAGLLAENAGLSAQTYLHSNNAMSESLIVTDPAITGMGSAGLASTSSYAWASFRNPAILPFGEGHGGVAGSWQNYSPSASSSNCFTGAFSIRLGRRSGVSAGISNRNWEAYERFSSSGTDKGMFEPNYIQGNVSYGHAFSERFSVGITARIMQQSLYAEKSTTAFAGDLFVMLRSGFADVTAGVSNLGPDVPNESDIEFALPYSMAVGASRTFDFGVAALACNIDANWFFNNGASVRMGAECGIAEKAFVRAGGNIAIGDSPIPSGLAAGAGFRVFGISVDASYIFAPASLAGTLCAGLSYAF